MIDSPGYGDTMDIKTWKNEVLIEIKRRINSYHSKVNSIRMLKDD